MKSRVPKPFLLRPMDARRRRWFKILVFLAVVIVVIIWGVTIHRVLSVDFSRVRSQIDTGIEKASSGLRETTDSVQNNASVVSEVFDQAKGAYQQEKERQEQEKTEPVQDSETMNP